jgi:hypothetical protein
MQKLAIDQWQHVAFGSISRGEAGRAGPCKIFYIFVFLVFKYRII